MDLSLAYDWIALNAIPGLGARTFYDLLQHFETPQALFKSSQAELTALLGPESPLIKALLHPDWDAVDKEIKTLEKIPQMYVLTFRDPNYPQRFLETVLPPPLLYVRGDISVLKQDPWLAVVGTRQMTSYGSRVIQKIIPPLILQGVSIVSGFALGVDIEAHAVTLKSGGKTVAVMGSGLYYLTPQSNKKYIKGILEQGAFVSEFSYFRPPMPALFPRRNRLISALAQGVLVIEADIKSGSLITARYGLEQNRDIFAIPGPIDSQASRGTNKLLQEGAIPVTCADDILKEWGYETLKQKSEPTQKSFLFSQEEQLLYNFCQTGAQSIDDLIAQTGFSTPLTLKLLTQLELSGHVTKIPGELYKTK